MHFVLFEEIVKFAQKTLESMLLHKDIKSEYDEMSKEQLFRRAFSVGYLVGMEHASGCKNCESPVEH